MQIIVREERERGKRKRDKRFVVGAECTRSPSTSVKRNDQWRTTDAGPGPYFLKSDGEGRPTTSKSQTKHDVILLYLILPY